MKFYITTLFILLNIEVIKAQTRNLSYFVEQAKINSPLINKSKNASTVAELDLKQIKSILSKPVVNLEANVLFAPIISHDNNSNHFEFVSSGATNYSGYDLSYADGGRYETFVSVRQPLFTGSVYENFAKKAEITKQINENSITLTQHELEQLVNHQYILCLKAKKQSEISLELVKELKEQLQIMKNLVKNAIYEQTDLMLLRIELQNYENENLSNQAEYKNNLYGLNLLCGINDTNFVEIQDVNFELKYDKINHSQFLTAFKLDSLSLTADQILFEQKYKPQLNLLANTGLSAIYTPSLNRLGFSTGLSFTWNIFDGNQRTIQREKTNINLKSLEFEKQNFITRYDIQKSKYLNNINSVNQQINALNKQLIDYRQLLEIYKLKLSQAQISIMDFKNLIKEIALKKQENVILNMEKQALINSYNYWNF
ncbi:MAG: TolC family protein [Chlorobi bacterium]|nr:TolC family protein [Chlorobiota bacterium]